MKRISKKYICFLLLLVASFNHTLGSEPPFKNYLNDDWVNEKLSEMTLEEKIAQLIMISVYPKQNEASKNNISNLIETWKPGGIIVMQGTPVKTTFWINEFQEKSNTPLLVAIDGEWGLSMRIDSTINYPKAQAIGAIKDSAFIYQMGRDLGTQLKQMGIHVNFAPVADVNTNPDNPVINFRSFGEDKLNVAKKAWWISKGMQDVGVIPVAKHFPGHGDTKIDSHKALPLIEHSKARIDSIESFPFRYLTEKGISGIMSAHLSVPSLDESGKPSSISKKIITNYLKNEIGFSGFIVTDAINMQGVRTEAGNTELEALKAGNDMVEFVPDIEKAIYSIKNGVETGEITLEEIEEKCRKILAIKRWVNLNEYKPASVQHLTSRLNSPYFEVVNRKLIQNSLTVLQNQNILPVENLDTLKIASITLGNSAISAFQKMLSKYTQIDHFYLNKNAAERDWANLRMKLENYNLVIVGIEGINIYPAGKYGTSEIQRKAVSDIIQEKKTIVSFFGNAYALKHFENIHHSGGLIVAYQNNQLTQELAAQLIFGGNSSTGALPVTVDNRFKLNDGIQVKKNESFSYTIPEEVGIDSKFLIPIIDSIANSGIEGEAYPGCQVLIAKDGKVIFHKTYGFHTYEKLQKVEPDNIYDWASITKVIGPLPAIMKLVDENKFSLDAALSKYYPDFKNSNKENLKIREILAHQSQLAPWIPFWQLAVTEKGLDKKVFKNHPSKKYNVRVSEHLYMNEDFRKTMFDTIRNSKLMPRKRYLYSGLSFYLFPGIIENIANQPYEDYIKNTFYKPLGANSITYNAYKYFPLENIIPTENDELFRKEKLHGFVHDEGAAMMGGVSGNAGLFGTTNDLAKIFQMYLQKGFYGGKRYISEKTINEFTRIQFPQNKNRRGLGFDKPLIDNYKNSPENSYPAVDASKNSFGHTGFTGTFAWADPDNNLLYIFMTNRVYPTRENQKLYHYNIRTGIQQSIYDGIKKGLN